MLRRIHRYCPYHEYSMKKEVIKVVYYDLRILVRDVLPRYSPWHSEQDA